jgi:hypothetical protein
MSQGLRWSLLALAIVLCSCSRLRVRTEYDPDATFSAYRSYAWLPTAPGQEQAAAIAQPGVRGLVIRAIDREMAHKGLVRTTPNADPEFFVSVMGWSQRRVEVTDYGYPYGPAYPHVPGSCTGPRSTWRSTRKPR